MLCCGVSGCFQPGLKDVRGIKDVTVPLPVCLVAAGGWQPGWAADGAAQGLALQSLLLLSPINPKWTITVHWYRLILPISFLGEAAHKMKSAGFVCLRFLQLFFQIILKKAQASKRKAHWCDLSVAHRMARHWLQVESAGSQHWNKFKGILRNFWKHVVCPRQRVT